MSSAEYQRRWRERHPEHKEKEKEYFKMWKEKNKEYYKKCNDIWKKNNKDKNNSYKKKCEEKRSKKAGTSRQIVHICLSACTREFSMTFKEWRTYQKENQLACHHCFGLCHPECFVVLPKNVHAKLHKIYGAKNDDVPFDIVRKYCAKNGIYFKLVGYLD